MWWHLKVIESKNVVYLIFVVLLTLVGGCNSKAMQTGSIGLNSRYNDEQPALSGDGRWLALVSNRQGTNQILLYDIQQKRFQELPGLNRNQTLVESPSLSLTARYVVYITNIQGRPDIALYDRLTKRSELLTLGYRSWVRNPSVSPDGRYVVFETARRGQWDIEVLDRGPFVELDIPDGTPVSYR
jgi:Tol biopolymer transport system component